MDIGCAKELGNAAHFLNLMTRRCIVLCFSICPGFQAALFAHGDRGEILEKARRKTEARETFLQAGKAIETLPAIAVT
jgi:hypothetical protein